MGETERNSDRINSYKDLRVYQNSMDSAMEIFQLTKTFPPEENILWLTKYGKLHDLFVQILGKLGVIDVTKLHLSQN